MHHIWTFASHLYLCLTCKPHRQANQWQLTNVMTDIEKSETCQVRVMVIVMVRVKAPESEGGSEGECECEGEGEGEGEREREGEGE